MCLASVRTSMDDMPRDRVGRWARWCVRGLFFGAVGVLVASCGSATPQAGAPATLPAALPTASARDERAVTTFIDRLRHEHADFQPAAEWSAHQLILAVPDPTSTPWLSLDGRVVGGLVVTVLHAQVSTKSYEHAIVSIGHARFAERHRIQSFGYPPDGSYVVVRVRRLSDLDPARRAALTAKLEGIASVAVRLVEAPRLVRLVGVATS